MRLWSTADLSLLTLVKVLLQRFTTSSYGGPYFDSGWSFYTASVLYGAANVTRCKLGNGSSSTVMYDLKHVIICDACAYVLQYLLNVYGKHDSTVILFL